MYADVLYIGRQNTGDLRGSAAFPKHEMGQKCSVHPAYYEKFEECAQTSIKCLIDPVCLAV